MKRLDVSREPITDYRFPLNGITFALLFIFMKQLFPVLSALIIFGLLSFTSKKATNKDFKVVSAQSQTIYGGAAGSPIVTRYTVKVKTLRAFTLSKDSAFAEGRMDAFQIMTAANTEISSIKLKKGKTATLVFTIVTPSDMGGSDQPQRFSGSPVRSLPIAAASGVVVRYRGGKSVYLPIDKVTPTEPVMAP